MPYTDDVEMSDGDDLIPDKTQLASIVQNNLVAPPTPQPSPDAMALAAIAPGTVRVDVENASGMSGAARAVADNLRKAGFTIGEVGNADVERSREDANRRTFDRHIRRREGSFGFA